MYPECWKRSAGTIDFIVNLRMQMFLSCKQENFLFLHYSISYQAVEFHASRTTQWLRFKMYEIFNGPFPLLNSIFILAKRIKSFTTARKSMLELAKLPSLVAKYCKIRKTYACEVCNIFVYFCITHGKPYHKMAEIHRKW